MAKTPAIPKPDDGTNSTADAFLREVDDAVRKSDFETFMRRYGWWIAGLLALIIAGWGGYILWQQRQGQESGKVAEAYIDAVDNAQSADKDRQKASLTSLDMLAKQGDAGYATAAKLTKANLLLSQGNKKAAIALYTEVAADSSAAQPLRDLALIRQTVAEYDEMKPQAVIDRLAPLTKKGVPFYGTAGEMTGLSLLALDKKAEAGKLFESIALDETVPGTIRSRAQLQANQLGLDVDISPKEDDVKKKDSTNEE